MSSATTNQEAAVTTTTTTEKKSSSNLITRIFSVTDQFSNYYFYHQSKTNQIIHFIFVPVLAFSLIMLAFQLDLQRLDIVKSIIVDRLGLGTEWCNLATVGVSVLGIYYLILDLIAGSLLTAEFFAMLVLSHHLHLKYIEVDPTSYYMIILVCQVVGWGTQFYGHYLEGKRPALIDNVFQIFIAPLFVLFELLFMMGLRLDLKEIAEKKLKEKNLAVAAKYSKRNVNKQH